MTEGLPAAALVLLGRRIRRARRRAMTTALSPYIRPVKSRFGHGTRPGARYWADCFRRACEYVLDHSRTGGPHQPIDGLRLVHGLCREGDVVWAHAWVALPGGLVFDGVRQQFYDRDGYQRVMQATEEATYDASETVERMLGTRHYGPWHAGLLGRDSIRRIAARRLAAAATEES